MILGSNALEDNSISVEIALCPITNINLSHNRFTGPPPVLAELTKLRTLNLDNNKISNLRCLSKLISLQDLGCGYNLLVSLPSFGRHDGAQKPLS